MASFDKKPPFIPSGFSLQESLTPYAALNDRKTREWGYDVSIVGLGSPAREIVEIISLLLKGHEKTPTESSKEKMKTLLGKLDYREGRPFNPFLDVDDPMRGVPNQQAELNPFLKNIIELVNLPHGEKLRLGRKLVSQKELMLLLERVCRFTRRGGMSISLDDFAYPLTSFMKGTGVSKEEFLTHWLRHSLHTRAHLSDDGEILLSLDSQDQGISEPKGFYDFKVTNKGTEIVVPVAQTNKQEIKKEPEGEEFIFLYKKYLRALTSSLSFTRCASKLTRIEKLYSKDLKFKPNLRSVADVEVSGLTNSVVTQALSEGLLMPLTMAQKIANAATEQTNNEYVVEEPIHTNGEIGYAVVKSNTSSQIRFGDLEGNQVIRHLLANQTNLVPLVLSGEAGMGKTVSLTQFAFKMICRLEDMNHGDDDEMVRSMALPLFIRAKRYSNNELEPNPSEITHKEISKMVFDTLPDLQDNISREEFVSLIKKWNEHKANHNSELIWFIDGIDECENPSLAKSLLRNVLHSKEKNANPPLIISTRPSHYSVVKETIQHFGIVEMKANDNYYTKDELSRAMPEHLCDAWGITRASGRKLAEIFDEYQDTLIHPLFIGWFCYLILENKLEEIESHADDSEISQNNLIAKIIEIGVQSSLKRRETRFEIKQIEGENNSFEEILHAFIAVSFHYQIGVPEDVFKRLEMLSLTDHVDEETQKSLLEDCGILFLSGDKIEWTHRTIPEIIYADYYYNQDASYLLGPLRVSSPVLNRIAQLRYEEKEFSSYQIAKLRTQHHYLSKDEFVTEVVWDIFPRSGVQLFQHDGDKIVVIEHVDSPLYTELGKIYLEAMKTPGRFPMSWDAFAGARVRMLTPGGVNSREIVEILVKASTDPFCLDLVTFDYGDVVPHDLFRYEMIQKETSVSNCFAYYRTLLETLPENVDLKHPVWSIHKIAQNFGTIFDIRQANGDFQHMVFDVGMSWLGSNLDPQNHDLGFGDEDYAPDEISEFQRYKDMKDVVEYITEEYIHTAYEKLFGKHKMVQSVEFLWNELADVRILRVTGSGEYTDVEDVNLLGYLLESYDFDTHMAIGDENFSLDAKYDTKNIVVKGLLLMPFVSECIRFDEFHSEKRNPFAPKPNSEFIEYIQGQFTEDQKGMRAFHFVTQYTKNLE